VPYTDIVAPISPEPVRAAMAGIRCTSRETWPFGDSAAISLALTAQHLIAFKVKGRKWSPQAEVGRLAAAAIVVVRSTPGPRVFFVPTQRLKIELTTGESFAIEVPWVFRKDAAAFAALYE
jgi:hypothetical protein